MITFIAANLASIQALSWPATALILIGVFLFAMLFIGIVVRVFRSAAMPQIDVSTQRPAIEGAVASVGDSVQLEIRFDDYKRHTVAPYFRIGIYNPGPLVARNVELWIDRITGSEGESFTGHLPHRLQTLDGKEKRCDINPDREELFEVAAYQNYYDYLTKKPTASVITSKPAIHDHFKTGQRDRRPGLGGFYASDSFLSM